MKAASPAASDFTQNKLRGEKETPGNHSDPLRKRGDRDPAVCGRALGFRQLRTRCPGKGPAQDGRESRGGGARALSARPPRVHHETPRGA